MKFIGKRTIFSIILIILITAEIILIIKIISKNKKNTGKLLFKKSSIKKRSLEGRSPLVRKHKKGGTEAYKKESIKMTHSGLPLNSENILKVKKKLKDLLKEWIKLSQDSNIRWQISDGTLLGAVRDQDIMPWDDDIDLRVHKDDWYKVQQIYSSAQKAQWTDNSFYMKKTSKLLDTGDKPPYNLVIHLQAPNPASVSASDKYDVGKWFKLLFYDDMNSLKSVFKDFPHIDIVKASDKFWKWNLNTGWWPAWPWSKSRDYKLMGLNVPGPIDPIPYLEKEYGKDFKFRPYCITEKNIWIKKQNKSIKKGDYRCPRISQKNFRSSNHSDCPTSNPRSNIFDTLLKYWDKISRELEIPYSITYGSYLGWIRNKNYIPWDEDMDVHIGKESVEKLMSFKGTDGCCYPEELKKFPLKKGVPRLILNPYHMNKMDRRSRYDCQGNKVNTQTDSCSFTGPVARAIIDESKSKTLHVDIFVYHREDDDLEKSKLIKDKLGEEPYGPYLTYVTSEFGSRLPNVKNCKLNGIKTSCFNDKDGKHLIKSIYGKNYMKPNHICSNGKWIKK